MRRVTVRVQQDGDWLFRAERTDGQVLFEIEFAEDGGSAAPAGTPTANPELPAAPAPAVSPVNDLIDDQEDKDLDEVLRALGRAMPQGPPLSRVVEIGGLIGRMTKRLDHFTSGDRSEPIYMVEPFLGVAPEFVIELQSLLSTNVSAIAPRMIPGSAAEAAAIEIPMNADLICISAELFTDEFEQTVLDWIRHLSPSGMILSRLPKGISVAAVTSALAAVDLEVADLGYRWFLATRKQEAAA